MDIAESPISKTGNTDWDKTFNECFWENMRQVMWSHSCMFNGQHYVAKGYECNWCGCKEEDEPKPDYVEVVGDIGRTPSAVDDAADVMSGYNRFKSRKR